MNDLELIFQNNNGRQIYKYKHYFDIYDRHFSRFRNKDVVILEIGVLGGGSLQMWKTYFGEKAKIYGIDINPECKKYEEGNINILIGSQSDKCFLEKVKKEIPQIDILIDDGGHMMSQQKITFENLFDHVKSNGVYLVEDTHTSYFVKFGGGYKRIGTFIEYSKYLLDFLNATWSEQKRFKVNNITKKVDSIHFYDSIVVFEKKEKEKTETLISGVNESSKNGENKQNKRNYFVGFLYQILVIINCTLRFFRLPGFIIK